MQQLNNKYVLQDPTGKQDRPLVVRRANLRKLTNLQPVAPVKSYAPVNMAASNPMQQMDPAAQLQHVTDQLHHAKLAAAQQQQKQPPRPMYTPPQGMEQVFDPTFYQMAYGDLGQSMADMDLAGLGLAGVPQHQPDMAAAAAAANVTAAKPAAGGRDDMLLHSTALGNPQQGALVASHPQLMSSLMPAHLGGPGQLQQAGNLMSVTNLNATDPFGLGGPLSNYGMLNQAANAPQAMVQEPTWAQLSKLSLRMDASQMVAVNRNAAAIQQSCQCSLVATPVGGGLLELSVTGAELAVAQALNYISQCTGQNY